MQPETSEVSTSVEIAWEQLRPDLIARVRRQLGSVRRRTDLSDEALLLDAGLAGRDEESGAIRPTLAALLLLGSDEAIRTLVPHHGTLAVFKAVRGGRGAREDIRTNLLETHDRLVAFAGRHLPDHLESAHGNEFSLRDSIFSEIFSNSLIFRDYSKVYPARFVIEPKRVVLEYGQSLPKPDNLLAPLAPVLLPLFGQATGESLLATGGKAYFGLLPLVFEGSVTRIVAPFPKQDLTPARPSEDPVDLTESFASQAPWTTSNAAQTEILETGSAVEELSEIPIPEDIIVHGGMQGDRTFNFESGDKVEDLHDTVQEPARPASREFSAAPDMQEPLTAKAMQPGMNSLQPLKATQEDISELASSKQYPSIQEQPLASSPVPTPFKPKIFNIPGFSDLKPAASTSAPSWKPAPWPGTAETGMPESNGKNYATVQADRTARILEFCRMPRYRAEVQAHVGINNRDYFRKDILNPLIESGQLAPTLPDKPNSPKQQYRTVVS